MVKMNLNLAYYSNIVCVKVQTIIRGQDIRRSGYRFRSKTGHDTECRTDKIASRNFYL